MDHEFRRSTEYYQNMDVTTEGTSDLISMLIGLQTEMTLNILNEEIPDPGSVKAIKNICVEIDRRIPVPTRE